MYDSLQVLVYYNLIENREARIYPRKNLSSYGFYKLSEKILGIKLLKYKNETELKSRYSNMSDFIFIDSVFKKELKILSTA